MFLTRMSCLFQQLHPQSLPGEGLYQPLKFNIDTTPEIQQKDLGKLLYYLQKT